MEVVHDKIDEMFKVWVMNPTNSDPDALTDDCRIFLNVAAHGLSLAMLLSHPRIHGCVPSPRIRDYFLKV